MILEYEIPKYDGDLGTPNVFVELGRFFSQEDLKRQKTVFSLIEDKAGIEIVEADQIINACIVTKEVAKFLDMKEGQAILSTERTYFSQERKPVEVAISYYRPDLYQYEAKMIKRNYMR